jgi:hypothetical protein
VHWLSVKDVAARHPTQDLVYHHSSLLKRAAGTWPLTLACDCSGRALFAQAVSFLVKPERNADDLVHLDPAEPESEHRQS